VTLLDVEVPVNTLRVVQLVIGAKKEKKNIQHIQYVDFRLAFGLKWRYKQYFAHSIV
jgi:hypothetical protein